jgi:ATP-binding cassette subfamily F protein uup
MALISARKLKHSFGLAPLLDNVDITIETKEKVAFIGRNGAGKSTLMRMLAGQIQPDEGEITWHNDITTGYFEQEIPDQISGRVFDVVSLAIKPVLDALERYQLVGVEMAEANLQQLATLEKEFDSLQSYIEQHDGWDADYQIEQVLTTLGLDGEASFDALSGGKKRRVMLAKAMVKKPDILFLDEPTNHLDVASIEFLENLFANYDGTLIFVSHDRTFINKVANRIVEIDRGQLFSFPGNYQTYQKRKADMLAAEQSENKLFDKKLADEEVWIRQGIKARRTRNEGRVRALEKMRAERAQRRSQQKNANINISQGERSSKIIAQTRKIGLQFDGKPLFTDLTTTIVRGDKIGIIGPNGVGKSSLIKVLLGAIEPTEGSIKYGMNLEIGYLDQLRDTLQDNLSIIDNIREGSDFVNINGKPRHIMSYMQDFLFSPERIRTPVGTLSGGERNRVLLAKLFTKPINVLVMDEPTNDLDIETLEVLEDLLVNYDGTLLLISHDRAFLDNIATSTLVFENGDLNEYVGGYQDWLRQRPEPVVSETKSTKSKKKPEKVVEVKQVPVKAKLSYEEQRELGKLPNQIEKLEVKISKVSEQLQDVTLYDDPIKAATVSDELKKLQQELEAKMDRWMELES